MDLLDISNDVMYFDEPLPAVVQSLLDEAAAHYRAEPDAESDPAEQCLRRADTLAPDHLAVLVALYRFYYYRQRYAETLRVADRAIVVACRRLGLDDDWRRLTTDDLEHAGERSMAMTRFLLLALKGAGWLLLRLDAPGDAVERLLPVVAVDPDNRLGGRDLLSWARKAAHRAQLAAQGHAIPVIGIF